MINPQLQETIDTLKLGIEKEIENIEKLNTISIPNHIILKNLQSKLHTLLEIESILSLEKNKIVFIGTVGVGKTTAICHLFNLIGNFSVSETINDKKRQTEKTQELLATGSGRTTICEVIIKANDRTFIEIEPFSAENMENLIIDFCDGFSDLDESSVGQGISREIERALRNIVDFKLEYKTNLDGNRKQTIIDRAKQAFDELGMDEFKKQAISKAELHLRNQTIINFESGNEKSWIKDTFRKINQGELKEFAIPSRIRINVSKNIYSGSELDKFDSVIDTKGIDEIAIRKDLEEYINEKDTICLFSTAFNSAPETNILELMKYALQMKSKDLHHKFSIFVLPKRDEPENENGGDGTWNTGTEMKKDVIKNVYRRMNLELVPDNILFYDSLKYYHKGKIDNDYENDVQAEKNYCYQQIMDIIERRNKNLENNIYEINNNFLSIKKGNTLSDIETNAIIQSINEIKELRFLRFPEQVYKTFSNEFVTYYRNHYPAWNTKHAIHKRFGFYPIKNIDIYYDSRSIVSKTIIELTKERKDDIEKILNKLTRINPDLETLIPELIKQFRINYDNFIEETSINIESFLLYKKLSPQNEDSEFWNALISEKGRPRPRDVKYTDIVCQTFKDELVKDINVNLELKDQTEKKWAKLIESTLCFFGSDN